MRILFITGHKYLPQMQGGLQNSTHQLCETLMSRGHHVAVLAGLMPGRMLALVSRIKMQISKLLNGHKVAKDHYPGYAVWRTWRPWETVEYVVRCENPDLVVVLAMNSVQMALAARRTGIPILMQLQDVEYFQHGGNFSDLGDIPCVANSNFTAHAYEDKFGVKPDVIYPFILSEKYKTVSNRENVTFINPVPAKGCAKALEIATLCPDIPFSFVEGWPLTPTQRVELSKELGKLPNVKLIPPQTDMRKIYGKCKILLAPSVWEEAYGRVATEAQFSGIPVIASSRGGLPEAVGRGGILLDPEAPTSVWAEAIRKLWNDDDFYKKLQEEALLQASQPQHTLSYKLDAWERILAKASKTNP